MKSQKAYCVDSDEDVKALEKAAAHFGNADEVHALALDAIKAEQFPLEAVRWSTVLGGGTRFWVDLNFIDTDAYSFLPIHKASEIEPLIRHGAVQNV
jgi:hypothetical protein